jgi:hypothetical protein
VRRLWILAVALAAGCSNRALPLPVSIVGLNDMVRFAPADGGLPLLFMTSTDRQELRVLDLDPNLAPPGTGNPRDFIRAPNPIEPLSIPVLNRPIALAADVTWSFPGGFAQGGVQVQGPYLYAQSAADSEISIVNADRAALFELCRLEVSGTVTAMASRAPDSSSPNSRLYYATVNGAQVSLWETDLPGPGQLLRATAGDHFVCVAGPSSGDGGTPPPLPAQLLLNLSGEAIVALMVMPAPHTAGAWPQQSLVVATHGENGGGRTLLLDTQTLSTRSLGFPGPVRALTTHPGTQDPEGNIFFEGSFVYGVLDESACGDFPSCNGVVAVDMRAGGTLANDLTGQPMLNMSINDSLITGLTVVNNATIVIPEADPNAAQVGTPSLVGILSSSNGGVYFFDGLSLEFFNGSTSQAGVTLNANSTVLTYQEIDAGGLTIQPCTGPLLTAGTDCNDAGSPFEIAEGAANTQLISITYCGTIPGLTSLPTSSAEWPNLTVPAVYSAEIRIGDVVELTGPDPTCDDEFTITSTSQTSVTAAGLLPGAVGSCGTGNVFSVRAGGQSIVGPDGGIIAATPYVVTGSVDSYMGRVAPNGVFTANHTTYYVHPLGFQPPGPPEIIFEMQSADPACVDANGNALTVGDGGITPICQDDQYQFNVASNWAPLNFTVDPRVGSGFQFPGAVQFDDVVQRIYVAFPAADGVLEVPPALIAPNTPNYLNLQPYR